MHSCLTAFPKTPLPAIFVLHICVWPISAPQIGEYDVFTKRKNSNGHLVDLYSQEFLAMRVIK